MNYKTIIVISFITILLIIISTTYLIVIYTENTYTEISKERITTQAKLTSERVGSAIRLNFDSTIKDLKILSNIPEVSSGTTDECNKKVKETYEILKPRVSNIFRINKSYITDCNVLSSAIGYNASNSTTITAMFSNGADNPILSNLSYSPISKKYLFSIYLPQFKNGQVDSVLGIVIYLDEIQKEYLNVSSIAGGYVTLADDTYTILYNPSPKFIGINLKSDIVTKALGGKTKSIDELIDAIDNNKTIIVYYTREGVNTVTASVPTEVFPGRKWLISTAVPAYNIVNSSSFITEFITLSVIIAILVIALLTFLVVKIINPIENLTKTIEEISTGNLDVEIDEETKNSDNEIGKLVRAFSRILVSLKLSTQSSNDLKKKIEEKDNEKK